MNISKNVIISRQILLMHKVRTGLSLSGIVIGICAVIVMVAVGRGTEARIVSQITKMGSNLLIVNAGRVKVIAGRVRQTNAVTTLEPRDAQAIMAKAAAVNYAVPAQYKKLSVKYNNLSTKTTVYGATVAILPVRSLSVRRGRFFEPAENKGRRRVAVLGQTVVDNIFGDQDPVGQTIRIGRVPFEVIGILAPKGLDINGSDQDDQIIVPLRTSLRRLFNLTYINAIFVQAKGADAMNVAEQEIRKILRLSHHLRPGRADDFTIRNQAAVIAAQRESGQAFTLLIASTAAVSLLVGGIGIMAVMLISIRERIKEIGLRRAVGAKRSDILAQFMAESLILSISGGLIGIIIGLAGAAIIAYFAQWPLIISPQLVTLSFLATISMGIVFGIYPAMKAARLDPIRALQFE
jgi:putative ABC transport system permease protein